MPEDGRRDLCVGEDRMIFEVTSLSQLTGLIGDDFRRCLEGFCKRAKDPLRPDQIWGIIVERLGKPNFGLLLALDNHFRVQGFAMLRMVADAGLEVSGDIWRAYIDPKAPKQTLKEGLEGIRKWFKIRRVKEIQFASRRKPLALIRRIPGLQVDNVIYTLPVEED